MAIIPVAIRASQQDSPSSPHGIGAVTIAIEEAASFGRKPDEISAVGELVGNGEDREC